MNNEIISSTIKLYQSIISSEPLIRSPTSRPPKIKIVDGEIKELRISQTLIKKILYKGDKIEDVCWRKIYHVDLIGDYAQIVTESMKNGIFFETICLGKSNNDESITDLPRKRNGEKKVDQIRIEEQAFLFKQKLIEYGMMLVPGTDEYKNVQVHGCVKHEMAGFGDIDVFIEGTADMITPIEYQLYKYDAAVGDLKLTIDRNSTYGYYSWGKPEHMDHIQAFVYSYLFNLPFFYWVFDYNSKDRGEKIIFVNTNTEHPDTLKANEARIRFKEMFQSIRTVAAEIITAYAKNWPTSPEYNRCKSCPVLNCKDRTKVEEI